MKLNITKGRCGGCHSLVTSQGSLGHLKSCRSINSLVNDSMLKDTNCFIVRVYEERAPRKYWMYILVPHCTTFAQLEQFILETWLDCGCGHSTYWSGFSINNKGPDDTYFPLDDKEINRKIHSTISIGDTIGIDFDGSKVQFQFIKNQIYNMKHPSIKVLVRNIAAMSICEECGDQIAKSVCTICGFILICSSCADFHDDDETTHISNSPRTGFCGYTCYDDSTPNPYSLIKSYNK